MARRFPFFAVLAFWFALGALIGQVWLTALGGSPPVRLEAHTAYAGAPYDEEDTRYAIELAPLLVPGSPPASLLDCIVWHESRYDPNATGDGGLSLGAVQLHEYGLLPMARGMGIDPWDPYEATGWLAWAISQGMGSHWAAYALC